MCALAVAVVATASCGPQGPGDGLVDVGAGLRGLPGLRATVLATGLPAVAAMAVDDRGRLWAATAAYTDDGKDGVYVVGGPGAAPVEVLSGVKTPLGLLWKDGTLYVSSTGQVDAYSDLQGTRFARHATVVTWPADAGESNGLATAPDGRLLVGVSAPCDHCAPASPWSAAILSFRPEGGDLAVYAKGIRAPIALAYYPGTSDLFVTMNQRDDLGDRTPGDWLSLVRQGDDWRFPGCYGQGGDPCAGVPAPVASLDPHAAAGGLAIVAGQLGPKIGTSAVVAEWAMGRVQRVVLARSGSAYTGSAGPFLAGLKSPLPVLLGRDGTLLVGDWRTGTVYRVAAG